jgi:Protein of unknown function (DUF4257)
MKLVQRMLRLTVCVLAVSLTIGGAAHGQQPVASDTAGVIGKGSAPDTSRKNLQAVQATTLPASISVTFLVAALLGAVGGLASTLIGGSDSVHVPSKKDGNIDLGLLSHLLVGAVAAMITVSASPPTSGWLGLVGAALTGGIGGPAVLLALVQRQRAEAAKAEAATHKSAAVAAADKESSAHKRADVADQAMKQLRARHADAQKAILVALAASFEPQQRELPGPSALHDAGVTVLRRPADVTRALIASLTALNETNA